MRKIPYLLFLLLFSHASLKAQLPAGTAAPDFSTTDVYGNPQQLSSYLNNGQYVVLYFFATWNAFDWDYWNSNMLQSINQTYGPLGSNQIQVLAIEGDSFTTIDDLYGTGSSTSGNFMLNATMPVIDDSNLSNLYAISYYPTLYIICPTGIIISSDLISPLDETIVASTQGCETFEEYTDLAVSSVSATNFCDNAQIQVTFFNAGNTTINTFNYTLTVDGVSNTLTYDGLIYPGYSETVTLSGYLSNVSSSFDVQLEEDMNTWNNAAFGSYIYQTPFESTSHVRLDITTDEFPSDITWTITDASNSIVAAGGPYYNSFANYLEDIFLNGLGCYSFNLFDSSDNGIDTEEQIYFTSVDDWGNSNLFAYDGSYEYGQLHVPFQVIEAVPVSISGYVFEDLNQNGLMDLGEPGIGNVEVHLDGMVTLTNENGGYAFNDVSGNLTSLSIVYDNTLWPLATTSTTFDLTTGSANTYNFGLNNGAAFYDAEVWNYLNEFFICNSENALFANAINFSNEPINMTVTLTLDPLLIITGSTPAATIIDGNTLTWTLYNILPGASEYLMLSVLTPGEELLGFPISMSSSFVATDMNGMVVDEGNFSATVPFVCGFDPNEMIVNPKGLTEQHYISNGTEMEYIIHFQNIGNYPVQNVIIENQLSNLLDYSTLEITGASHAGQLNFNNETGMLEYVFHDIYLPDAENNEAMSHGYLRYAIQMLPELAEGTVINNSALIYFDQNEPIYTNQVFNTLELLSSVNSELNNASVQVYPNPANDFVNIDLSNISGNLEYSIINAAGQKIQQSKISGGMVNSVDVQTLASGYYQVEIRKGENILSHHRVMIK
jgi:uncharacterized repeat protein (TIGR01451 family)